MSVIFIEVMQCPSTAVFILIMKPETDDNYKECARTEVFQSFFPKLLVFILTFTVKRPDQAGPIITLLTSHCTIPREPPSWLVCARYTIAHFSNYTQLLPSPELCPPPHRPLLLLNIIRTSPLKLA